MLCLCELPCCIPGMRLRFVQPLQDQTIKEGNTVRFDIELTHENVPVVWYRNEVKLHVSRTVLIHVEGKKHTLEMRTLSLDDTCQIKAETKGVYSTAKLTVIGNSTLSFMLFVSEFRLLLFIRCLNMLLASLLVMNVSSSTGRFV